MRCPSAVVLLWAALCLVPTGSSLSDEEELLTREQAAVVAASLKIDFELETERLERELALYASREKRRRELSLRLSALYDRVSTFIFQEETDSEEEEASEDEFDILEEEIREAEQSEEALRSDLGHIRRRIVEARERLKFLQSRLEELEHAPSKQAEGLTGKWDVTFLPAGNRGVFDLRQSGTIISGEYSLAGGWRGSVQGTLVNFKIVLHRIDSKLGEAADLEGTVTRDLNLIRGTWQNRVLSDGGPQTGAWTARRRDSSK